MAATFPSSPLGVARPGWKFIIPLIIVAKALFLWANLGFSPAQPVIMAVAILPAGFAIYVAYFFRDPKRPVPKRQGDVCCPADGKVVSIIEIPAPEMPGGRARRVAIFLNVFNVHIQRTPIASRVTKITKKRGKFMNAMNEKCSEENENLTMWLEGGGRTIGVRQITGAIARRIVCYAKVGTELKRGERYGLIQFGSRVEVFLPMDAEVRVKIGQKVSGSSTLLAVLPSLDKNAASTKSEPATAPVGS